MACCDLPNTDCILNLQLTERAPSEVAFQTQCKDLVQATTDLEEVGYKSGFSDIHKIS